MTDSTIGDFLLSSIIFMEPITFTDYCISGIIAPRGKGAHKRRRKVDHAPSLARIGREITRRNGLRRALGERGGTRRRGRAAHLLRPFPRQGSSPADARRREVQ